MARQGEPALGTMPTSPDPSGSPPAMNVTDRRRHVRPVGPAQVSKFSSSPPVAEYAISTKSRPSRKGRNRSHAPGAGDLGQATGRGQVGHDQLLTEPVREAAASAGATAYPSTPVRSSRRSAPPVASATRWRRCRPRHVTSQPASTRTTSGDLGPGRAGCGRPSAVWICPSTTRRPAGSVVTVATGRYRVDGRTRRRPGRRYRRTVVTPTRSPLPVGRAQPATTSITAAAVAALSTRRSIDPSRSPA